MENNGKYALITGGSQGIGLELAKLFAADGYNLVLVARDESLLLDAKAMLSGSGVEVVTISRDLFEPNAAMELYEQVSALGITIDTLVNDAGQGVYGKFIENELERELAIIQLNIISLVSLTKLYLKDFVARGNGKILNLSSIAGKAPGPYQAVYHATKAFVQSFTEAIRSESKDTGVCITALLPGATDTDFFAKADMLDSKVLDGELADPADVAKDGYDALMAGKDMVVSGFKNKLNVALGNITPDHLQADQMGKMQEPRSED